MRTRARVDELSTNDAHELVIFVFHYYLLVPFASEYGRLPRKYFFIYVLYVINEH